MSSSRGICTVTASCATPTHTRDRTNITLITGMITRARATVSTHGHSHGLVDESIKRSREGVRPCALALAILGVTASAQAVVFALSGSLALLADLIHNGGDALTAVPLGIAFALRSPRAERLAGLAVVATIFISACVAKVLESIMRLIHPSTPGHLLALALAGVAGFAGNWLAALVRSRAGRPAGQSCTDRRRRSCPRRRICLAGGYCEWPSHRHGHPDPRSPHRPRHDRRDPAHHPRELAHGTRTPTPPLTRKNTQITGLASADLVQACTTTPRVTEPPRRVVV